MAGKAGYIAAAKPSIPPAIIVIRSLIPNALNVTVNNAAKKGYVVQSKYIFKFCKTGNN